MKNLLILILIATSFTFSLVAEAQTVLLSERVEVDSINAKYGQNLSHFIHAYGSFGFHVDDNSIINKNMFGKSTYADLGVRYNKRAFNFLHFGTDLHYAWNHVKVFSTVPTAADKDSYEHHFNVHSLGISPYLRFNFYNKGNRIAFYLDVNSFVDYNFKSSSVTKYEITNPAFSIHDNIKQKIKGRDLVEPFTYGLGCRLGYTRYALFMNYSFEKVKFNHPEAIFSYPYTVGLQIGFY